MELSTNKSNGTGRVIIKNVILYDSWQHVSGFAELRTDGAGTSVKVRHNLNETDLLLNIDARCMGGKDNYVFALGDKNGAFDIDKVLDLNSEIVVCLVHKDGGQVSTAASGAINLAHGAPAAASVPASGTVSVLAVTDCCRLHEKGELRTLPDELRVRTSLAGRHSLTASTDTDADAAEDLPLRISSAPLADILEDTEILPISRKTADGAREFRTEAAREIDELLRAVCTVDEKGKGICETCPYREHFFGDNIDGKIINNPLAGGV